jgi:hypothetical protein
MMGMGGAAGKNAKRGGIFGMNESTAKLIDANEIKVAFRVNIFFRKLDAFKARNFLRH